jgi:hypothetical protein
MFIVKQPLNLIILLFYDQVTSERSSYLWICLLLFIKSSCLWTKLWINLDSLCKVKLSLNSTMDLLSWIKYTSAKSSCFRIQLRIKLPLNSFIYFIKYFFMSIDRIRKSNWNLLYWLFGWYSTLCVYKVHLLGVEGWSIYKSTELMVWRDIGLVMG